MSRWVIIAMLMGVASLPLVTLVTVRLSCEPHPVNRVNYEKIREGMSQREVEEVLGCPPGDYSRTTDRTVFSFGPPATEWISDDGEILVWFNDDVVWSTTFHEREPLPHLSLLERLLP